MSALTFSRGKRFRFHLAAFLLTLLGLEFLARVWIAFGPDFVPGSSVVQDPVLGYVNEGDNPYHLRGRAPNLGKPNRVLVIGDSVAYGVHLEDDETFPAQLGHLLGDAVEVMNSGTTGYNTWQERRLLNVLDPLVRPTVVVLQYCRNDRWKSLNKHYLWAFGVKRTEPLFVGSPTEEVLWRYSGIAHALYLLSASRYADSAQEQVRRHPPPVPWISEWETEFAGLLADASRTGRPGLLLLIPTEDQLAADDETSAPEVPPLAERAGMPILDVLGAFREAARSESDQGAGLYMPGDSKHLSARGCEVVATELARVLRPMLVRP